MEQEKRIKFTDLTPEEQKYEERNLRKNLQQQERVKRFYKISMNLLSEGLGLFMYLMIDRYMTNKNVNILIGDKKVKYDN